jgi:hypothetical protein
LLFVCLLLFVVVLFVFHRFHNRTVSGEPV